MDRQEQGGVVERLVVILRKVTRVTQMAPFVFLLFFAVYLLTEPLLPDWALRIADNIFNLPVYLIACLLGLGRLLKLCKWYITACLLPLLPKFISYIDSFVVTLWYEEVIIVNTFIGLGYIVFLIFAYRHFFGCDGCKKDTE